MGTSQSVFNEQELNDYQVAKPVLSEDELFLPRATEFTALTLLIEILVNCKLSVYTSDVTKSCMALKIYLIFL